MGYGKTSNLAEGEKRILGREKDWNHKNWKGKSVGQREEASLEEWMEIVWGIHFVLLKFTLFPNNTVMCILGAGLERGSCSYLEKGKKLKNNRKFANNRNIKNVWFNRFGSQSGKKYG